MGVCQSVCFYMDSLGNNLVGEDGGNSTGKRGAWLSSDFAIRSSLSLALGKRGHFSTGHFHSPQLSVVFPGVWKAGVLSRHRGLLVSSVSKSATLVCQKAPKPFSPRSATFNRADAGNGRSDQRGRLGQGSLLI